MKRKDILKDAVSYIFKTMMKDNNSIKKWRIKILSICLSAILLVSIIVTTVCVTALNKEHVVFTELKLPEEKNRKN